MVPNECHTFQETEGKIFLNSIFSLISFLSTKLYAYYEKETINKFCFLCHLVGGSPFEGSDRNENLIFFIIFYVLPAHKISLQSDNFYFLAPNLRGPQPTVGLGLKNKYSHSSCRKKLHKSKLKKFSGGLVMFGYTQNTNRPKDRPTYP